jgi:hypothetical protein
MCCFQYPVKTLLFPEDGGSTIIRNVCKFPPDHTASQQRKWYISQVQPRASTSHVAYNYLTFYSSTLSDVSTLMFFFQTRLSLILIHYSILKLLLRRSTEYSKAIIRPQLRQTALLRIRSNTHYSTNGYYRVKTNRTFWNQASNGCQRRRTSIRDKL